MSIYLSCDGNEPLFLASNLGWSEFGDWADKLDAEKYQQVVTLWEHGISQEVDDLQKQLKSAIADESPDANTADVATSLLELSVGAEVVSITDGMGPTS